MKKQGNKTPENTKSAAEKKSTDENLPGYPHYAESEDIMNKPEEKLSIDIENAEHPLVTNEETVEDDDLELEDGTEADVTRDDLDALGDEGFNLNDKEHKLVVPGAEQDDAQEEIGSEDEENNFYSNADN